MINHITERLNLSNLFTSSSTSNQMVVSYSQQEPVPTIVRTTQMKNVQYEGLKLFERKNRDYGDAFARYGSIGVLMRIGDKISRLQSITKNGIVLVDDERVRDTLIDLHNYSAMAVMLLDEGKGLTIEDATYTDEHDFGDKPFYKNKKSLAYGFVVTSVGVLASRFVVGYLKNRT